MNRVQLKFFLSALMLATAAQAQPTITSGFNDEDFRRLTESERLRYAGLQLLRGTSKVTVAGLGTAESKADGASGIFVSYDVNQLIRGSGTGGASYGSCSVSTFAVGQAGVNPPLTFLDARASLSLSATAGQFNVPRTSPGIYGASLSQTITIPGFPGGIPGQGNQTPVLEPGNFVMRGSGGADVGPFEARVSIPGNFIWTNQDAVTQIVRSRELEITWSGGSPANEYVFISGTSTGQGGVGASFESCSNPHPKCMT
jgi:hypothetical protein